MKNWSIRGVTQRDLFDQKLVFSYNQSIKRYYFHTIKAYKYSHRLFSLILMHQQGPKGGFVDSNKVYKA